MLVCPVFNVGVLCTVVWTKLPLGTEVGVGLVPSDSVRWLPRSTHAKGHSSPPPTFQLISIVAKVVKRSPISATAKLLLKCSVTDCCHVGMVTLFNTAGSQKAKIYGKPFSHLIHICRDL